MGTRRETFESLVGSTTWMRLLAAGQLRTFAPGTVMLRQGDRGGFLFAIERGRIALTAGAVDGSELLITVRAGGHLVGELADEEDGRRNATVRAIDQCVARYYSRPRFDRVLVDLDLGERFQRYLVGKVDQAVERQLDLAHRSAGRRVAALFVDMVELAPAGLADRMRIPFTQEELSSALGLARSTVAEQIANLRRAGALTPGRRLAVADLECLRRNASADVPLD